MSRTGLPGWDSLLILKSYLTGRLARLRRRKADNSTDSRILHNTSTFFELDLRSIFITTPLNYDIHEHSYQSLEHDAHGLLSLLDGAVNENFIESFEKTDGEEYEFPSHLHHEQAHEQHSSIDTLTQTYPNLGEVVRILQATTNPVSLTGDTELSIFTLPAGEYGQRLLKRVSDYKTTLSRYTTFQSVSQPENQSFLAPEPDEYQYQPHELRASTVVGAIFKELQHLDCNLRHEIRLLVSEELLASSYQPKLEMFISCCLEEAGWQETQCGPFLGPCSDLNKQDSICASVQRSRELRRKLHLFLQQERLFDVSDHISPGPTSLTEFSSSTEPLGILIDKRKLSPILPRDYLTGSVTGKVGRRGKAMLALVLARCLMEFFGKGFELTTETWSLDRIFLSGTNEEPEDNPQVYVSLSPTNLQGLKPVGSSNSIAIGDPLLLSFAKLLLEIDGGEKLPLNIQPQSRDNLGEWAKMCAMLSELQKEGRDVFYLKAIQSCLYLHLSLQGQDTADVISAAIYKNVVRNLENEVNPGGLKRKRRDSIDGPQSMKKRSIIVPSFKQVRTSQKWDNGVPYSLHKPKIQREGCSPIRRSQFEVAIVCALSLEYDAISFLIDEFWDTRGDQYGRSPGDENVYRTGRMGKVNVVLLLLADIGKASAASAVASLRSSYTGLKLVLVPGICGGVPKPWADKEILLGDVVIGKSIVQYDYGRLYPDRFESKEALENSLGRLRKNARNWITLLGTSAMLDNLGYQASSFLEQLQSRQSKDGSYSYPGTKHDKLFEAAVYHKHVSSQESCLVCQGGGGIACEESRKLSCEQLGCDVRQIVPRKRLALKKRLEHEGRLEEAQAPTIFIGRIGSGDTVIKSAEHRDRLAREKDLLAFEMEGAGVWDEVPCLVVKGVCDYADSHKSKLWQNFAAATSACVVKAMLERYPTTDAGSPES